jgi:glycosyltransferase involved in cell wall biosynthesis
MPILDGSSGRPFTRLTMVAAESLTEGFAPFSHTVGLAKALSRIGYNIDIIGEDSGPYHGSSFLARIWRYLKVNARAIRALGRSDIMIARGHFAHLPWTFVASLRGIPVVHEMNGQVFDAATTHRWLAFAQSIITSSYRRQFRRSAGIACVTSEIAESVRMLGVKAPVTVIGNGVDVETFYPSVAPSDDLFAVFPSSLTAWHGVSTLLAAIEDPAWPKNLRLMIVGDGAHSQDIRDAAQNDERIQYLGLLRQKELSVLLRNATIGLSLVEHLPERVVGEVYPLKLFEMMASGLPIVATDVRGQSDVVNQSGAGILVPEKDPVALARAVSDLFARGNKREIGARGAAAVAAGYSWDHRAAELSRFVEVVMADSRSFQDRKKG